MAKCEKAEKSRDETKAELDKLKNESQKMRDMFTTEWNEVVEKSLKDQNDTSINAQALELEQKLAKSKTMSSEKKERGNEEGGSRYAQKLRGTVARSAWAVARDTG
jgi:hypothetical protein